MNPDGLQPAHQGWTALAGMVDWLCELDHGAGDVEQVLTRARAATPP